MEGSLINKTYEDVTMYRTKGMSEHYKWGDGYKVEVEVTEKGTKARVHPRSTFMMIVPKSRLNKLNVFGRCHNVLCSMVVNGQKVYFKLPDVKSR